MSLLRYVFPLYTRESLRGETRHVKALLSGVTQQAYYLAVNYTDYWEDPVNPSVDAQDPEFDGIKNIPKSNWQHGPGWFEVSSGWFEPDVVTRLLPHDAPEHEWKALVRSRGLRHD